MSEIILPGPQPPKGGLTLWVPRGAETKPIGECYICGIPFFDMREPTVHLPRCAREHGDVIRENSLKARLPIFDENEWDPEVARHMRRVGKRMIRERRLEVKPSERAGF